MIHDERGLRRVLSALRPYRDELVVIGGWVPYLYLRYGGLSAEGALVSFTREVDVLLAPPVPPADRPPLAAVLRAAGFEPALRDGGLAVWEGDRETGARIEFLAPHGGTSRTAGATVPVGGQAGIAAISLPRRALLHRFRRALELPAAGPGEEALTVLVPTLGAYAVNKATTFPRRGTGGGKRAKDLLYLRDVMAIGAAAAARVEADAAALATDPAGADAMRDAVNLLDLALGGSLAAEAHAAADMLREREPVRSAATARADVLGHLADLRDLLRAVGR